MILLDKYFALEKADNQYQLGIIDEQTKISIIKFLNSLPSAQSDNGYSDGFADGYKRGLTDAQPEAKTNVNGDWVILNKDKILKAGMEGREIEFRIGGRLFAIREKAQ